MNQTKSKEALAAEIKALDEQKAKLETDLKAAKSAELKAIRQKEREDIAQFRAELEREWDMTGHPKADLLWQMAWEDGHSSGKEDVRYHYERFVELVK